MAPAALNAASAFSSSSLPSSRRAYTLGLPWGFPSLHGSRGIRVLQPETGDRLAPTRHPDTGEAAACRWAAFVFVLSSSHLYIDDELVSLTSHSNSSISALLSSPSNPPTSPASALTTPTAALGPYPLGSTPFSLMHKNISVWWGESGGMEGGGLFRERVKEVDQRLRYEGDSHGIAVYDILEKAHKPVYPASDFDGDWEKTIKKAAASLPPMTVLINGRGEPCVVFDMGLLFEDDSALSSALTLTYPTPFALSPPRRNKRVLR
ncbi:hypothetical protein B0H19DRAFT_1254232 [Mycena capillaripes]|nr:hypothetical protein B0H19DRAFT_1254232 [Mycena capillaripes]